MTLRIVISNAADFGRVAVMFGGISAEREVSLDTGSAVLKALQSRGVDAHPWDPADKSMHDFDEAGFERVWIALHGTGGEDGAVQGALQWLNTPYTGSGVMGSHRSGQRLRGHLRHTSHTRPRARVPAGAQPSEKPRLHRSNPDSP